MSYQGGKQQIGKKIHEVISILEEYLYDEKLDYIEPFVGFCGVIKHFAVESDRKCFATDLNKDIILMWKALQKGWKPPTKCSKNYYENLKVSNKNSAERGFIGVACSYAGIFFVGYRGHQTFNGKQVSSAAMTSRSILKITEKIKNVNFMNPMSYTRLRPNNKLIYCDPPYESNKYPSKFFEFDSEKFWNTMRKWSKNNLVVVSERNAPKDFKKIWCENIQVNYNRKQTEHKECLYIHESIYDILDNKTKTIIKNI